VRVRFVRSCVLAVAAVAVVVVAGCGVPQKVSQQAEELQSIAAEGALLAQDLVDGRTISTFARVHAGALRKKAETLRTGITDPVLGDLATDVVLQLSRLEGAEEKRTSASVQGRLEQAARRAETFAEGEG
jgi:outer membrane murein-binding lipoprotein Lpp